ncbi:MAG: helix-turn-helix domain-containing protein [Oscillospiraceae bacterium]|nr:helix-turn-helix domain-containing protein [Oscillospiraceae bacterium]
MFHENLSHLRRIHHMTQEELSERVGVSRQALAKWESGETVPDLEKCRLLSEVFGVSLDDLANYEPRDNAGLDVPPRGKHLFGVVTVGDKGQIVIPAKARRLFSIQPGDSLVVLGDEAQGIALLKSEDFLRIADMIRSSQEK